MIKLIMLLKRRPDLTMDEFIDRYENGHAKLAAPRMGDACRYVRRYLRQVPDPISGEMPEAEFDVISEVWFADSQSFAAGPDDPAVENERWAALMEDEKNLFDRSRKRFFVVEEYETDLKA
jgi:hypothetical protein